MTPEPTQDGYDQLIGLDITSVTADEVRASLVVTPDLLQPYGLLHGGVLCSIVESLGSIGGAAWFADRGQVVGTSNHTDLLRSARDGAQLHAVATPVHRGRTAQLWSVEVRDEQDKLIATGRLRVANLPAQQTPAQETPAQETPAT